MKSDLLLYAVTDRTWTGQQSLEEQVEEAVSAGVTLVQLREKNLDDIKFIEIAKRVKKITDAYGVKLIINDNVPVALACDAAGVHVGQGDMEAGQVRVQLGPDKILGVTVRTAEQAVRAQEQGADYLGAGAVFGSVTKEDARPLSFEQLKAVTSAVTIPVVAIGGINQENISQLKGSGVAGAAIISGIFGAADIGAAVITLKTKSEQMVKAERPKVLSIAGSDCSGGAGIQADLKAMTALGTYGMSVITALTAQNTTGVSGIFDVAPEFVASQMDCVFSDIVPDAVKIGMVSQQEVIQVIAAKLKEYRAANVVLDPVMVSTSGSRLLQEDAVEMLVQELFPLASVITPNIPEAELLSGMTISTEAEMEQAAVKIAGTFQSAVLVKGGHQTCTANDVLYHNGKISWFYGDKVNNPNTHGTGCTLSSAIASGLAKGKTMEASVRAAKQYLSDALRAGLDIGKGSGPLDHCFFLD